MSDTPLPASRPVSTHRHRAKCIGLMLAPVAAMTIFLLLPDARYAPDGSVVAGLDPTGKTVAAVGVLMAVLWVTEALPVPATALCPIALFPLLTGGKITVRQAAAPYAHELIFLFMGGFLIALAMQRWNLHRRIALRTVLLVGTRPHVLVAGFMAATAFLSMWVSNTATVVMMLPIANSVVELLRVRSDNINDDTNLSGAAPPLHFPICLMLGIAYAASIGGVGTLVGTPPNVLLAAFLKENCGVEISFARWMLIGMPLVAVFLPITWLLLTRVIYPIRIHEIPGSRALIQRELDMQGPITRPERAVLLVFIAAAALWITRPLLEDLAFASGWRPLAGLTDPGIAMAAALLLFAVAVRNENGTFLLTWHEARKLPWGVLVLFGGGLSLASAISKTGVAEFLGHGVGGLSSLPQPIIIMLIITLVIFLTELTSNTATTAAFLPILAAVAVGMSVDPVLFVIPAAIAASCAFMLPVATPPNALVFASGEITIPQMCRAGVVLNAVGILLITTLTYLQKGDILIF